MGSNSRIYFALILLSSFSVFANALKAEFSAVKLPIPAADAQPFYDGLEYVYLFGGHSENNTASGTKVLRYNVYTDVIEEVGQLPTIGIRGSVQALGREIYYFGGYTEGEGYRDVVKFNILNNTATFVKKLHFDAQYHATMKPADSSDLYFLRDKEDGSGSYLYLSQLPELPFNKYTSRDVTGYTSAVLGNRGYIFGQNPRDSRILEINLDSFVITSRYFANHIFQKNDIAVTDGLHFYIIESINPDSGSEVPVTNSFFRIALDSGYPWNRDYPEVENYPVQQAELNYLNPPSPVFVDRLNRIYYFGGKIRNSLSNTDSYVDDIWYIDLSTPEKRAGKPFYSHH